MCPWITASLRKSICLKNKLYRTYTSKPTNFDRSRYVGYKNYYLLFFEILNVIIKPNNLKKQKVMLKTRGKNSIV